jgi:DnaJ-class molecular chaperone
MNQKDYYQILEVEKEASPQKIKEAYRRLAFQYHPDRNKGNPSAVEKMKEINEAYAVLSDPKKRRDYNTFHEQYGPYGYDRFKQAYSEQDIFRGSDVYQIFEEMARAFGFRGFEEVFVWPGSPHLRISKTRSFWQRVHIFRSWLSKKRSTGDSISF